jgi:hypothetical protein
MVVGFRFLTVFLLFSLFVRVNARWQLFVFVYVLYRERLRILLAKVRGFLFLP